MTATVDHGDEGIAIAINRHVHDYRITHALDITPDPDEIDAERIILWQCDCGAADLELDWSDQTSQRFELPAGSLIQRTS